jgi:hypothetical protein
LGCCGRSAAWEGCASKCASSAGTHWFTLRSSLRFSSAISIVSGSACW